MFDDGKRWLIKFPVPGKAMLIEEKLRSEAATMRYVREHTRLKIPEVIGWGPESGSHPTGFGFILTEYLGGERLGLWKMKQLSVEQRSYVYR
jgi:hypothetical protein